MISLRIMIIHSDMKHPRMIIVTAVQNRPRKDRVIHCKVKMCICKKPMKAIEKAR